MAQLLAHGHISGAVNLTSTTGAKGCHLLLVGPSGAQLRTNLKASAILFALWHPTAGKWSYLGSEWKQYGTGIPHRFLGQTPEALGPQADWPDFDSLRTHELIIKGHLDFRANGEGRTVPRAVVQNWNPATKTATCYPNKFTSVNDGPDASKFYVGCETAAPRHGTSVDLIVVTSIAGNSITFDIDPVVVPSDGTVLKGTRQPFWGAQISAGGNQIKNAISSAGLIWSTGDSWAAVDDNWKAAGGSAPRLDMSTLKKVETVPVEATPLVTPDPGLA